MYLKPLTFNRNLMLVLFLVLALGCAGGQTQNSGTQQDSLKTQAYKVLMTDKQIYDATFKSLALLDSQGKLPAAVKAKSIALGNKYMVAHNLAVQTLLDNGQPSLAGVRAALDAFLVFAAPYASGVK
ncbi:conserved exported hypothetical protein [Desulfarculales bacterium]